MKEIYRTTSLEEAQVFCSLLREHEIEPLLDGEHSGPVSIGLYTTATPLIVHVPDEDEAAAAEILDAMTRERSGEIVFERGPGLEATTAEEDARFREDVGRARASQRRRWLIVGILIIPAPLLLGLALVAFVRGETEGARDALLMAIAYGAVPFLIHVFARPAKRA